MANINSAHLGSMNQSDKTFADMMVPGTYWKNQLVQNPIQQEYDKRFFDHVVAFNVYKAENRQNPDVAAMRYNPRGLKFDTIAFPGSRGYYTYNSDNEKFKKFIVALFDGFQSEFGIFEPKLLIAHNFQTPFASIIHKNDANRIPDDMLEHDPEYFQLFQEFLADNMLHAELDKISIYMHTQTSPGPTLRMGDGTFYSAKDIAYDVVEKDKAHIAQAYLDNRLASNLDTQFLKTRRNYMVVKKSFLPRIKDIYDEQKTIDVEKCAHQYPELVNRGVLSSASLRNRYNSVPKVENIEKGEKFEVGKLYYTKDRAASALDQQCIINYTLNAKALSAFANKLAKTEYMFAPNRARHIYAVSWSAQVAANVCARMMLQSIEESVHGFASARPEIYKRHAVFIEYCKINNLSIELLTADRSNAESVITENYPYFLQFFPPVLLNLIKVWTTILVHGGVEHIVQGCLSGIGFTTLLNYVAGLDEYCRITAELLSVSRKYVLASYIKSVRENSPFFLIKGNACFLTMPTDDIPATYGMISDVSKRKEHLEKTADAVKMEIEFPDDEYVAFGQKFTKHKMELNTASIIAKLPYSESGGFFSRDVFQFAEKLHLLPNDQIIFLSRMLKMHLNEDLTFYRTSATGFLRYLRELGIPTVDVLDPYSPSGQIVFGRLISMDELFDSTRVDREHIEYIFDDLKKTVCPSGRTSLSRLIDIILKEG